jgi:hypothetical protein
MLILFDHGTPAPLRFFLTGHTVKKAKDLRWDTLTNGELLRAAEAASFQVLVATDKNIRYQQNLSEHAIAIVVLGIPQTANPAHARGPRRGRGKCCEARHLLRG